MRNVLVAVWVLAGCGGDDATTTETAALVSLAIDPATSAALAPGATATLSAVASFDDGTTEDVSGEATWTADDDAVATVDGGVVTGVAAGEVAITAEYDGQAASTTLTVADAGPFAVTVTGDWSKQHGGQGLTFYARVVDEADGLSVACGATQADAAVWSLAAEGVLVAGHKYHAEAFADVNGDGQSNDVGHTYQTDHGKAVEGAQDFDVAHAGGAPDWSGAPCGAEATLAP